MSTQIVRDFDRSVGMATYIMWFGGYGKFFCFSLLADDFFSFKRSVRVVHQDFVATLLAGGGGRRLELGTVPGPSGRCKEVKEQLLEFGGYC